jgi:lipoprotein-anchoring transpeptidase ErfK/SrfK
VPRLALILAPLLLLLCSTGAACSGYGDDDPTSTPVPTETPSPAPATPTPFPTFTPTPVLSAGQAIVVGGELRVRSAPSTAAEPVGELPDASTVVIAETLAGENWLVGSQTWLPAIPDWTSTWYRLADGTYVYAGFIFVLQPGEVSPLADHGAAEKWIDVNVTTQTATAMAGETPVFVARVSTGSPQFPTPLGTHRIEPDGRIAVERMTATQAGYTASQARYDVERVLFTQYIDRTGNALHLNYWRPADVFGRTPTSHGCIGLQLHDAQYFWLFAEPGMRVEVHT